jgi:small-conductance mechanosensitive channel
MTERIFPQTGLDAGVRNSLSAGFGYVGIAIAAMLAVSALGLDLANIALIAGALSVGIGFGLQNIVNNFVSGLILLIERPIKVGDWINVGGHEGHVKQINVRATEIETFQRASVIVPNSELLSTAVINWTHKDSYGRAEVSVGVAYGSDVEKVIKILRACLDGHKEILTWPEPSVIFQNFGDSSLDFTVRGYIANVELRIFVQSELRVAIDRAFAEAGIEIPFPQRDVHIKNGNERGASMRGVSPATDT